MFKDTNDALSKGLNATTEQRLFWFGLRRCYEHQAQAASRRQQWNLNIFMACQAQFCREAMDARKILDHFPSLLPD